MKAEMTLFAVARLETFKRDPLACVTSALKTATGFLYKSEAGKVFLVTNKHVVFDEYEGYFPDKLRLSVHLDLMHLTKMRHIDLRLWSKDRKKLWKWARYRQVDVVALEVPADQLAGCCFTTFSKADILDADEEPLLGKDVGLGVQALVFGFPLGFYDKNTFLPMSYAATVATWPWLDFEGQPCFLVNAGLHLGMSGSPVISCPGTILTKRNLPTTKVLVSRKNYLLGVLSDERKSGGVPLGLNRVWHAGIIKKIVGDE
jgi:hypothetical protein